MNNQVVIIIILFFGLTLLYVLPLVVPLANAAQLESGVEIIAPTTTETEKICDDTTDNDNDGKIDGEDQDCVAEPKRPPSEIAEICVNGNDQDCVPPAGPAVETVPPAGPAGETCELQILDGVPINYGDLPEGNNPAWISPNQEVTIENVGTIDGKLVVKGGNWVSDAAGNPTVSGPNITRVILAPQGLVQTDDPFANPAHWEGKAVLQNNELGLGWIAPNLIHNRVLMFQMKLAPVMLDGGSFHQEVTIDLIC